jgi:hypothetical protein
MLDQSDDVDFSISHLNKRKRETIMTLFSVNETVQAACTNNIHRPLGGVEGVRQIHDDVGRLAVSAFPFAMVKEMSIIRSSMPGCYILADHASAYIGETNNIGRRLAEHAIDPTKAFAREVYVVYGLRRDWFCKTAASYLQYCLTKMAEHADLVEVIKAADPRQPDISDDRRPSLDRYVEQSERLLFDAGCRAFRSNFASQRRMSVETDTAEPDESGPIQIGVIATPPIGSELVLSYGDLWARGFPTDDDGFVVMAGSEVRCTINPSAPPIVETRRGELAAANALVSIPGVLARQRLCVAVRFPSRAIAAKVITGAHVDSSKWVTPRYPHPILITV